MATSVLYTTRDGNANSFYTTRNFGSCTNLFVGWINSRDIYAFMYFDTTDIVISNITECIVTMPTINTPAGEYQFKIEPLTSAFNEGTSCNAVEGGVLTWDNQPSVSGTPVVNFTSTTTSADITADITTLIQASSGNWFGFRISRTFDTSSDRTIELGSNDAGASNKPFITIDYDIKYFVKTGGSDSNDGLSWADAWTTIDKAANTAIDGSEVQIEGGTYNAEPAANDIAPVNAGTTGIKYTIWGTAGSGTADGTGTGSITVEKNA